jgi:phosphoserine phosphatase RsbU/P
MARQTKEDVRMLRLALLGLCLMATGAWGQAVDTTHWQSGTVDLTSGWRAQEGDDMAWAQRAFDDSGWKTVELDALGPARPGWRWYRRNVQLGEQDTFIHLLVQGGDGTYELYVNGKKMEGPELRSWFGVSRPTERTIWVGKGYAQLELALRTHAPSSYTAWHLPLFLNFELGTPEAIADAQAAAQSQRLYPALPSIAINVCVILAGLGSLALFLDQRLRKEYWWLGLYLLFLGLSNLIFNCSSDGMIPLAWNWLLGDLLIYAFTIMQVEFTFSFVGKVLGRGWRGYEALLVLGLVPAVMTQTGRLSSSTYISIQALLILPAALILPVLLLVWYRRGNREAGWLVLPSLFPAAATAAFDVGTVSIFSGWGKLDSLTNPISMGPISLQLADVGDFLFVLAIVVVMFFRFTRVSREQIRVAAELSAAREIQRRLVPAELPQIPGYALAAAYFPADEVGGDFYQVLDQGNGAQLVVVGDVSGKGLKAAMTGTLALGALRTLAAEGLGPAVVLTRLNAQLVQTGDGGFITCVCVRITDRGEATVANAGHLPPYCNGEEWELAPELPLGIALTGKYAERMFRLKPGDQLTLLSDGVVEARDAQGSLFGFARTRGLSAQTATAIAAAALQFGQEDDITVLTVTRTAPIFSRIDASHEASARRPG